MLYIVRHGKELTTPLYLNPTTAKVGIGITNPQEKVQIVGGVLKIGNLSVPSDRQTSLLKFGDGDYIRIGEWEADDMLSFKASRYNFTNGNVGINVTNPSYRLDVGGSFRLTGTSILLGNVGIRNSNPQYPLDVNGVLRTTGNALIGGNVGVRNTNPSFPLDVNGTVRLRTVSSNGGWGYSYFYWDRHTLVMGSTPGNIAHCDIALQPGGGDKEWTENGMELFSRFQMYSARSKTNKTLRVELCTEGHCWFNNRGNVGIKTMNPQYALDVNGDIRANGVWVKTNGADYVFDEDYPLPSLKEVERFIETHSHLPGVQSAEEMREGGVQISELVTVLLQKVEELTLYTIEQEKQIHALKTVIEQVKDK